MISNVRVIHVYPVTEAVAHVFPLVGVFPDRLLTFFYKRLYAVLFYILLAVKTEFFLDFEFDGKPVRIPARFTKNVIALHRAVSRNDVFHYAR